MYFLSLLLLPLLSTCSPLENKVNNFGSMERSSAIEFFQAISPKLDLTQPLRRVIPDIRKIPTRAVESCYEARFNHLELHLFNHSTTLFDILYDYYLTQPNKQPTLESIENLIHSAQSIVDHVSDCAQEQKGYKLGFTSLSDLSETEFRQRLGASVIDNNESAPNHTRSFGDPECYPPSDYSPPLQFDFRAYGVVTPVKNQGQCGSCWTFSTAGAIESAYLIRRKQSLDLSEQQLIDCAYWQGMGGCNAGTSFQGYQYVAQNGITSEVNDPYRGYTFTCRYNFPAVASIRKFCIRGQNNYGPPAMMESLSDEAIIAALSYFGPVGVYINADRIQNYRSGIINDPYCSSQINHAVLLVGYTEKSFIIKNSWGSDWGNRGFFELARGRNMCGINFEINYPLL